MSASEVDQALECAIAAVAHLQTALHRAGSGEAFNAFTMVTMLKRMRSPETVERLDAERLEKARAA